MSREAFEEWITRPPYERAIRRMGNDSAWPESYRPLDVDLAWQAWQAATSAQEARVRELEEALRSILGWRELRSGAGEIPIVRIEEIAREALSATAREE